MRGTRTCILALSIIVMGNIGFCQKKIELTHKSSKGEKVYNVDGAEAYVIAGNDTFFIAKIARYEFFMDRRLDSIALAKSETEVKFMVQAKTSCYYVSIPKAEYEKDYPGFKFTFYKEPKVGSFAAITFLSTYISVVKPLVIIPYKRKVEKFYR